jgi:hypothetical protein
VLRSPGEPLDHDTHALFEPRFGHDFSRVPVRSSPYTMHTALTVSEPGDVYEQEAEQVAEHVTTGEGKRFQPSKGFDFSHVRVHTDAKAAESAHAVNALAYTVGPDVVFGAGQYAPNTSAGRTLLVHELTHVVQQRRNQSHALQRASEDPETGGASEEEAKTTATRMTADEKAGPVADAPKKTPASCTRTIFSEGTCAFLVANSRFICCDPDNGIERKGKKTDIDGSPCPSEKFTPIFACDSKCDKALAKGCDDNDTWMAVPNNQFTRQQCGDIWTICANGKQTTGYVRDHSVTQTRFEVSPKIQKDLGVTVGSSFKGAIYKPGANQAAIDKDSCCSS